MVFSLWKRFVIFRKRTPGAGTTLVAEDHGVFRIVYQQLVQFIFGQFVRLLKQGCQNSADKPVKLLQAQRKGDAIPEKNFGYP